ncbi:MAG: class I tRNA ligase family protein, partial [Oscillospiraceae bacterium]
TARYILGNLKDFNPDTDSVTYEDMTELDKWAIIQLGDLIEKSQEAYDKLDFHIVYHAVHNFCTIDMSSFYLDILKDRLYCEKADDVLRRSAQTVIYTVLRKITLLLAPILSYTAEEIWSFMPQSEKYNNESVFLNDISKLQENKADHSFVAKWDKIHEIRDDVNKVLELLRKDKTIGKSLEAKVVLGADGELYDFLNTYLTELAPVFIVSQVELTKEIQSNTGLVAGLTVSVCHAEGEKCERCWTYGKSVGTNSEHPTLCKRCARVMQEQL